jgi:hypothetical protein
MVDATISRVRMHDLAVWAAPASRRRVVTDVLEHRQRLAAAPQSGQLAPRTNGLMASPI